MEESKNPPSSDANSGQSRRFGMGTPVIVLLHTPKEKYWGVLYEIAGAGVYLRGLDLNAFDEWLFSIVHDEPHLGPSDLFFPTWRVERLSRDESAAGIPSLAQRYQQATGQTVDVLVRD